MYPLNNTMECSSRGKQKRRYELNKISSAVEDEDTLEEEESGESITGS